MTFIGNSPIAANDLDALQNQSIARGKKLVRDLNCMGCHSRASDKMFPEIPFLHGQHQRYLVTQLKVLSEDKARMSAEYEIAERYNHHMSMRAANLSLIKIKDIAAFFAAQQCLSAGREVSKYKAPKLVKACAFCHGEQGRSPFLRYPKLAGQNMYYLIKQLKIMRHSAEFPGERNQRFHRTMAAEVINLTDADINELGFYYSRQNCR